MIYSYSWVLCDFLLLNVFAFSIVKFNQRISISRVHTGPSPPKEYNVSKATWKKNKHEICLGFVKWPSCVPHECLHGRLISRIFAFGSQKPDDICVLLWWSLQTQLVTSCSLLASNIRWYLVKLELGQMAHNQEHHSVRYLCRQWTEA